MTEPAPEYPEPIQAENVLPDGEPGECSQSIDVAGPIPCRLRGGSGGHPNPMLHMGFYNGAPLAWST
jgi:hypothetical protein